MSCSERAPRKFLIVNADDFGMIPEISRGILRGHLEGIITSASLMVRRPHATHAAKLAHSAPGLSVGLHLDLGEWSFRDGKWRTDYQVVSFEDEGAIAAEIQQQLETFRRLTNQNPSHIDSHQHVHRREPVRSILLSLAGDLPVPIREERGGIHYCGAFYGQSSAGQPVPEAISVASLLRVLETLPAGITELACHPGEENHAPSAYHRERLIELENLCAPEVRLALERENIQLCNFRDFPRL
jgi:predicted glycoside hydrolase/deacetylase ChbG (UPF0249 family)